MGEPIKNGHIYVAPPDYHLVLKQNEVVLDHGPRENRHRPSVDPLFRSAAIHFGPRVIGVILSGALDDGTAGLQAIKTCGGVAIVQHPEDAQSPSMPENALRFVDVDHCVPAAKMAALLQELVAGGIPAGKPGVDCGHAVKEETARKRGPNLEEMQAQFGPPNGLICPECSGPLWEVRQGKHVHFRCLVGHHFSPQSFLEEETEALERALWLAVKTLEERSVVLQRLAERAGQQEYTLSADQFTARARESEEHADTIRKMLQKLRL